MDICLTFVLTIKTKKTMKKVFLSLLLSFCVGSVLAQTAKMQIIHNSPDALAAEVDVYINGILELDNVPFRTATPFLELPAGVPLTFAIAPGNSTSDNDAFFSLTTPLVDAETYVVVADGIQSATGYTPNQPFGLQIYTTGRESAAVAGNTDVLIHHGSTDAPPVDIVEVGAGAGNIVPNISYTEFQGYLELATADYAIEVQPAGTGTSVAAYELPLATLGLQDAALVAVASGFLDPSVNSDGPAFGIFAALPSGGPLVALPISTSRVQIIHNSPDALASEVDIYLNGDLAIDDFAFRTATEYLDLPAGVEIEIAVAPGNSGSVGDAIATFPLTLDRTESYIVVANGIVDTPNYDPAPPFGLDIKTMAKEAADVATNVDIMIHHGSTDAPTVDIFETGVGAGLIANNLSYTDFRPSYLQLPGNINYAIEVRDETGTVTVAAYELPLDDLGIDGAAVTAVASGFLDPTVNNDGPGFGIFVALPTGGDLVELPISTARAQIIHNSADLAAEEVDVYINGNLAIDDFAFRTATEFIDLPAVLEIEIAVAPGDSNDVGDAIATFPVTLERQETYVVVADGIVSGTGYDPAQPFTLEVYDMGREAATVATNTDLLVHHGSTDAPTVDVVEVGAGAGTIVDDISYTEFQGYLELPTADYALEIRDDSGTTTVAAYEAPLATLGLDGAAIVAVASGFLDPTNNSDGPAFGIWVALPSGGDLVELPISTARAQIIHNSADLAAAEVDIYLNGALVGDDFAFRTASEFLDVPAGVQIEVAVAPSDSTGPGDAIATFPFTLARNETYIVVADGIVSATGYDPAPPFTLEVFDMGREAATVATNTDVLVHHGSTDAPTVDIVEVGAGAGTLVDDISYTEFQGYLELPTADYVIDVRDETGTTTVVSYEVPLSTLGLDGAALVAVASGFLDPSSNSNGEPFGIWVALPSGGDMIPLPEFIILNANDIDANQISVYPNPTNSILNVVGIQQAFDVEIIDMQGRIVSSSVSVNGNTIDVSNLAVGMYNVRLNVQGTIINSIPFIKE